MTRDTRGLLIATKALLIALVATSGLNAQERDGRWSPWFGCWEPVTLGPDRALLCVRPAGAGVDVSEVIEGEVVSTQSLQADGRSYDIVAQGCEGTRSAEFSADGKRLFTSTRQGCDGDVLRGSTGLMAMMTANEWIDVQAQEDDGQSFSWVRRYVRVSMRRAQEAGFGDLHADAGLGARRARSTAAATVDVDDVVEAIRVIDAEAVRSWIAALDDPFELDGRSLIRLADSGVPASVIDVMIAVSYPDRFAVRRDGNIEKLAAEDMGGVGAGRRYPVPVYIDPYNYPGYYGSPGYYGRGYGRGGYYGPGVVVVAPRSDPSPDARVVKGKGYSRGTSRTPSGGSPPSGPSVREQPSGGKGQPSSSGGSSTPSQGRKAKPRGS